ncbi:Peptidyl-prolyl cis-trans isomerase pin4 [Malassezia yamatoensis]|uniref:Peptidyl-prolyl cis-trans isomerase pin4 n=1 Tax=Malassezia yamatoensis TaxID=253288 RepID=A0AAJ5YVE0_9BASI|nr:Peptidyl-prolyl cis-trans isomerase pin4 [Malassezia yamatoensis]
MADPSLLESLDSWHLGREDASSDSNQHTYHRDPFAVPNSHSMSSSLAFTQFPSQSSAVSEPSDTANPSGVHASRFDPFFRNHGSDAERNHVHQEDIHRHNFAASNPDTRQGIAPSLPIFSQPWGNSAPSTIPPANVGVDRNLLSMPNPIQTPLQLGSGPIRLTSQLSSHPTPPSSGESDIIPTAIVIKNIPFNIKREQLLQIIVRILCILTQRELGIPVPYAFNYHFDQGIFRGLAFANFHSCAEASEVVAALNGLDVSGRKLRVEYKKVLQAGEKERIEKEKAIKRLQFPFPADKERKRDKTHSQELGHLPPLNVSPAPRRVESPNSAAVNGLSPPSSSSSLSPSYQKESKSAETQPGTITGATQLFAHAKDWGSDAPLDLNNADTLEIFSRVLLFKDDRMRDELAFSKSLTSSERRTVHLVAQKLGLYHYTVGHPDDCYVVVMKSERAPLPKNTNPADSRSNLRGKQSVPELKRNSARYDRDAQLELDRIMDPTNRSMLSPLASHPNHKSTTNLCESLSYTQDRRYDGYTHFPPSSSNANSFASPFDIPVFPHGNRPSSADIERLEQHKSHIHPSLLRSRSPLAPSGMSHPIASSHHATPSPRNVGPLDSSIHHSSFPSNAPGLPHRPVPSQNHPVDLMLDGHLAPTRTRMSPYPSVPSSESSRSLPKMDALTSDQSRNCLK